jgi:hypothetical protein
MKAMKAKSRRYGNERRKSLRFPIRREVRYKLLDGSRIVARGRGETADMSSGGIAFRIGEALPLGSYLELSVSWPVPLDDGCAMQLIVFGRVLRFSHGNYICGVEKWEFRTQSKERTEVIPMRVDNHLLRWVEYRRDVAMKADAAAATA